MNRLCTRLHALSSAPTSLACAVTLAAFAGGCASEPKPGPQSAYNQANARAAAPPPQTQAPKGDTASPTSGSIAIEDRILRACGDIPQAHFAFDSANIQPDAANALTALARCFSSGPLAGKGMRLVGHADPRGETEYNLALGQRRAGSVAVFVEQHGVPSGRVASTSRGAFDAVGTDENGWARDRRVDVLLAD
jgi:peptidoglycan-associated lipoprotein